MGEEKTSKYTKTKQLHFRKTIGAHLATTNNILKKYDRSGWKSAEPSKYLYIDTHCASGEENGIIGSPLIFIDEAKKYPNISFICYFIDKEKDKIRELEARLKSNGYHYNNITCYCLGKKCEEVLPIIPNFEKLIFGCMYVDPYGLAPIKEIVSFYEREKWKKLDLIMNQSCTSIKRVRKSKSCSTDWTLKEALGRINKQHWIIREPVDIHQWTFLIGSNWVDLPYYNKLGFRDTKSKRGREILEHLDKTNEEKEGKKLPKINYFNFNKEKKK